MSDPAPLNLPLAFQAVYTTLLPQRDALNRADSERGKHGDEIISLFAVLSATDMQPAPQTNLAVLFDRTADRAASISDNQSAQFYARGLSCFADALRNLDLTVTDLAPYLLSVLTGAPQAPDSMGRVSQGQLLKALIKGLSAWDDQLSSQEKKSSALSMGYLFDLGVDYLQALQHGATRLDAIVQTAVSHSPLRSPEYQAVSGKLVLASLLESIMHQAAENLSSSGG